MTLDFIRFEATDGLKLQGWLSDPGGDTAVVHVHGMSGNGYENDFLDNLRELYTSMGLAFLAFDNRGRSVINWMEKPGGTDQYGSCYELFEESAFDIAGAMSYLTQKGKTKIILQGHSLGCSKVVSYLIKTPDSPVVQVILLAPVDMMAWSSHEPEHAALSARAKELLAAGKPRDLVGSRVWMDRTPLSAQTYLSLSEPGTAADVYGERDGGALIGRITQPVLLLYGDQDAAVTEAEGGVAAWQARVKSLAQPTARAAVLAGAGHGFGGHETELTNVIETFLKEIN